MSYFRIANFLIGIKFAIKKIKIYRKVLIKGIPMQKTPFHVKTRGNFFFLLPILAYIVQCNLCEKHT